MNAFSSLTLWIILATIIPGFITIACLLTIIFWVYNIPVYTINHLNPWYLLSFGITLMVITQTVGMVMERIFIALPFYAGKIDDPSTEVFQNDLNLNQMDDPAFEYYRLYGLLSILQKEDDNHGHVQRTIGQFFLTNNTMAAYFIGFVSVFLFLIEMPYNEHVLIFAIAMIILYIITFIALGIRYKSMIKSIWITRQISSRRLQKALDMKTDT